MRDEDQTTEPDEERDLPNVSDEEMQGWLIDPPNEGPAPVTGVLSKKGAEALRKRVAEARGVSGAAATIKPGMTTDELRAAGVRIELPTEAASADPKGIAYADGTTLEERLDKRFEENRGTRGSNGDGGTAEEQ